MASLNDSRLRRWFVTLLPAKANTVESSSGHTTPLRGDVTQAHSSAASVVTTTCPTEPLAVLSKDSNQRHPAGSTRQGKPTEFELDTLQWGERLHGPLDEGGPTPRELENNSGRSSPVDVAASQNVTAALPTLRSPSMNKYRAGACVWAFFTQGVNDSVVGALLPYIEQHYHVSYAVVSLLFIANALGFLTAGPLTHKLNNRFGRSKILSVCATLNAIAFSAIVAEPPYGVVVVAFYLLGFGFATILALDNVFVVNLQGGTVLLGFMHGFYGIGGVIAPFVATAMVSNGIKWCYFYTILLSLSIVSTVAFFFSFRGYESEDTTIQLLANLDRIMSRQTTREGKKGILKKALSNRTTLLGGLLIFAYQGAEVSISGWVISFLIDYRNGNPAQVGYVTSGFWGGITLGRFLLVTPAHKLGDRISIVFLIIVTAGFQVMLWLMPNVVGNAVAVAIIGLLQGPIYPCAAGVFSKLLPSQLQITSLGLISGVGSSGGALAPFFTGLLAQRLGTIVLNPVCIVLYAMMLASWLGLPRIPKRAD